MVRRKEGSVGVSAVMTVVVYGVGGGKADEIAERVAPERQGGNQLTVWPLDITADDEASSRDDVKLRLLASDPDVLRQEEMQAWVADAAGVAIEKTQVTSWAHIQVPARR